MTVNPAKQPKFINFDLVYENRRIIFIKMFDPKIDSEVLLTRDAFACFSEFSHSLARALTRGRDGTFIMPLGYDTFVRIWNAEPDQRFPFVELIDGSPLGQVQGEPFDIRKFWPPPPTAAPVVLSGMTDQEKAEHVATKLKLLEQMEAKEMAVKKSITKRKLNQDYEKKTKGQLDLSFFAVEDEDDPEIQKRKRARKAANDELEKKRADAMRTN